MQTRFWVRRALLAIVWGLAVSTWAAIAHYLVGAPDIGLPFVLATMTFIMARPTKRATVAGHPSNAPDAAMHGGIPTA